MLRVRTSSGKPHAKFPYFKFYKPNGDVLYRVRNLAELVAVIPKLNANVLFLHLDRPQIEALTGLVIPYDLAFWLSHGLNEPELANQVLAISEDFEDPELIKVQILKACRRRLLEIRAHARGSLK